MSNNFLSREYILLEEDPTIHCAEICIWFEVLLFAYHSQKVNLKQALFEKFHLLLEPENARLIPMREAANWTAWGIIALQIIHTVDSLSLPLGTKKYTPTVRKLLMKPVFSIGDIRNLKSIYQGIGIKASAKKYFLDKNTSDSL